MTSIEWLRVLSLLGIIGYHIGSRSPVWLLLGSGIFNFLLLGAIFNVTTARARGLETFARDKWRRLMVPWVFWTFVYGVLRLSDGIASGEGWLSRFDPWMLLYGTHVHLWFVPFATASGIFVAWLHYKTAHRNPVPYVVGFGAVGALVLIVSSYLILAYSPPDPIGQYLLASSSPFLGFALARCVFPEDRTLRVYLVPAACVFAIALGIGVHLLDGPYYVWRMCIACLLVVACCLFPGPPSRLIDVMTPCLFGIYLVHPFASRLLWRFESIREATGSHPVDVLVHATAVFVLSLAIISGMRRTPLARFT